MIKYNTPGLLAARSTGVLAQRGSVLAGTNTDVQREITRVLARETQLAGRNTYISQGKDKEREITEPQ